MRRPHHRSLRETFAWPFVIGVLSAVGLVAALIGDALWDVVSWVTLAVPIGLSLWFVLRSRGPSPAKD